MLSNSCEIKPVTALVAEPSTAADLVRGLLDREVTFPAGLLGLPDCQRFTLGQFDAGADNPTPFLVLNSRDQGLSFLVIHPDLVMQDYCLPVTSELLARLGVGSERQLLPLLLVTVRERVEEITVNLQGPLVIGIDTAVGVQLVVEEYPLRYPLVVK